MNNMDFFETDSLTALQAKEEAQWIAFAPIVFQATRVLRNTGILKRIAVNTEGLTFDEIRDGVNLPAYGVRVLLESGLGIKLITFSQGKFFITKTGWFIINDKLTQVNLDFVNDVCYKGMFYLEESIKNEKPEGLKELGNWPTIYDSLSELPSHIQKSWFDFDHYYSDAAFPEVLPYIFKQRTRTILDIGGNTGKWALKCLQYDSEVEVTIMDLPGQVGIAKAKIEEAGFANRIHYHVGNVLDESQPLPGKFDVIWMSQFLDCFSESQVVSVLARCRKALAPGGGLYILEPFWDRQHFEASAFALQQTSLYFTTMANGNSQMYKSERLIECIKKSGFEVSEQTDGIGVSHSLLKCKVIE